MAPLNPKCDRQLATNYDGVSKRNTWDAAAPVKLGGQYFSVKLQHLSEKLSLTSDQQAEIKPILEQEAVEVGEICFNSALSRADTLNHYEKILRASDAKIKPSLSSSQLQKLQDLRKAQRQDVKRIIAEQRSK